jgi:hypothetical protein
MNCIRHRIIGIALDQVDTRGGVKYGAEGLWCGAFCVWVLREAGLTVTIDPLERPGFRLCNVLNQVQVPKAGDIVRYANNHCAIVLAYTAGGICTVDGAKLNEKVTTSVQLFRYTQPMTFYSIAELIRVYEMTGAETSQDVR